MTQEEFAKGSRRMLIEMTADLPEVEVASRTGQHASFAVRGKKFAYHTVDHHGDGRLALSCKAPKGVNALLANSDAKYFLPAYMAHHGWIGIDLEVEPRDWQSVREHLHEAYCLAAPKKLAESVRAAAGRFKHGR